MAHIKKNIEQGKQEARIMPTKQRLTDPAIAQRHRSLCPVFADQLCAKSFLIHGSLLVEEREFSQSWISEGVMRILTS